MLNFGLSLIAFNCFEIDFAIRYLNVLFIVLSSFLSVFARQAFHEEPRLSSRIYAFMDRKIKQGMTNLQVTN